MPLLAMLEINPKYVSEIPSSNLRLICRLVVNAILDSRDHSKDSFLDFTELSQWLEKVVLKTLKLLRGDWSRVSQTPGRWMPLLGLHCQDSLFVWWYWAVIRSRSPNSLLFCVNACQRLSVVLVLWLLHFIKVVPQISSWDPESFRPIFLRPI